MKHYPYLKKHGLTAKKLAHLLGYKSANAFRNSSAYHRILDAFEKVLEELSA